MSHSAFRLRRAVPSSLAAVATPQQQQLPPPAAAPAQVAAAGSSMASPYLGEIDAAFSFNHVTPAPPAAPGKRPSRQSGSGSSKPSSRSASGVGARLPIVESGLAEDPLPPEHYRRAASPAHHSKRYSRNGLNHGHHSRGHSKSGSKKKSSYSLELDSLTPPPDSALLLHPEFVPYGSSLGQQPAAAPAGVGFLQNHHHFQQMGNAPSGGGGGLAGGGSGGGAGGGRPQPLQIPQPQHQPQSPAYQQFGALGLPLSRSQGAGAAQSSEQAAASSFAYPLAEEQARAVRAEAQRLWLQYTQDGRRRDLLTPELCSRTHARFLGSPLVDAAEEARCQEGLPLPPQPSVGCVLFDLDLTVLSIHTRGKWEHPVEELAPFVNRCFLHLVPRLLSAGFRVGIVTFGDVLLLRPDSKALAGDALVGALLRSAFYHHFWCDRRMEPPRAQAIVQQIMEQFLIVSANPDRRNLLARKEGRPNDLMPASKRFHIDEIQRMALRRNWAPIPDDKIILFDDDVRNVRAEADTGVRAFAVDPRTGLRAEAWTQAMAVLGVRPGQPPAAPAAPAAAAAVAAEEQQPGQQQQRVQLEGEPNPELGEGEPEPQLQPPQE